MSERVVTIRYGAHFGYTFHYDRGMVVSWGESTAERNDMAGYNEGELAGEFE